MQSIELRKLAAEIRALATRTTVDRTKQAAQILDAAVALYTLQKKVQHHG